MSFYSLASFCFHAVINVETSHMFCSIDNSPVITSRVIDEIRSLSLSSTDDNKPSSVKTVTESTSGVCPQPTSQLPLSSNEQSSINKSVKVHCIHYEYLYYIDLITIYREVLTQ